MIQDLQTIDFQNTYVTFLNSLPASRQEFAQKRLSSVSWKKFYYPSINGTIRGYLAMPVISSNKKKHPVIIYNRGGNNHQSINGKKPGITPRELFFRMGYFAQHGFIVVGSNYSGGYESTGRDEFGGSDLKDIVSLYDLLPDLKYADEKSVGMLGYSRGGMMSYLCMKDNRFDLKAVAVVGGISDLVAMQEKRPEMLEKVFTPCFGGSKKAMSARSAISFVDEFQDIPLLLLHGTDDQRVDCQQSRELLQRGLTAGKNVQAAFYAGGNHSLTTHIKESFVVMNSWFATYLQ